MCWLPETCTQRYRFFLDKGQMPLTIRRKNVFFVEIFLKMGFQIGNIYDELAEFLASLSPRKVLDFHPSEKKQQRLSELLEKKRTTSLDDDEAQELEGYFILERIIRTAKAHALTLINHEPAHS